MFGLSQRNTWKINTVGPSGEITIKKNNPKKFISLGACVVDTILKVPVLSTGDEKIMAQDGTMIGAGMAVAAAATTVSLGGSVKLWGRIGDDTPGDFFLKDLLSIGVDTSSIKRVLGAQTAMSSVLVDDTGQRLVVSYFDKSLGADTSWLPMNELDGVDCVLVDVRWPEGASALMIEAKKRGVLRVFDGDVADPSVLKELAPLSTHAIFSKPGFRLFSGSDNLEADLLECTQSLGVFCGVTLGHEGFVWVENGKINKISPPQINALDTLAAGDVFHGAFALGLCEGMPIKKAGQFACSAAAIKCTRFGGRKGIPNRQEVDSLVAATYGTKSENVNQGN